MSSLFEQFILQEAIPKKAKELGISPEAPPDLTRPNSGQQDPDQLDQDPNQQQPDQTSPANVDPNAGLDTSAPEDTNDNPQGSGVPADGSPDGELGAEEDPNAVEGDPNDPNAMGEEDPNADPNVLQGPEGVAPAPGDEMQQADQELYAELKPEQRKIQTRELKERYQDLYKIVSESLDKLNKVTKSSYDANMIDFAMRQLLNIKDLIYTSITASFATRTYVENKVELEKLTTMFNSVTNMVSTIYEARVNRTLKYNKDTMDNGSKMDNIDFTQDLGF